MDSELLRWIALVVLNVPVYALLGVMIFQGWNEFFESLRYWLQRDYRSFLMGEWTTDFFKSAKMSVFTMLCVALVFVEYSMLLDYRPILYGEYELDVAMTKAQLRNAGASLTRIEEFEREMRKTTANATIYKKSIAYTFNGQRIELPYKEIARKEKCVTLKVETRVMDFCLKKNTLVVFDERREVLQVFKRLQK